MQKLEHAKLINHTSQLDCMSAAISPCGNNQDLKYGI